MTNLIERRKEIVRQAETDGRVDVDSLAEKFQVSAVTIRSDLNALSNRELIVRSRGGAVASTRLTRELSVQEKYNEHHAIKRRLGEATAELLGSGVRSILLDSGTTTEEVARNLVGHSRLTVMTNGLNIATALASADGIEIKVTGGTLRQKSLSFYGRQAEESLRYMHFDRFVLGVDGFDPKIGITTHFEQEANLNRIMCAAASEVIAVTDSSKFGKCGSHVICRPGEIRTLVTDSGAPDRVVDELRASGVDVRIVRIRSDQPSRP